MDVSIIMTLIVTILQLILALASLGCFLYALKLMSGLMREIRFSLEVLFPKVASYSKTIVSRADSRGDAPQGPSVTLSDQWSEEVEPRS